MRSENYPMESCRQLKEQYEACFNIWFPEKFLKGDNNDSMCRELLKSYTECVQVHDYNCYDMIHWINFPHESRMFLIRREFYTIVLFVL